jgi:hypothetical protein
MTDFTIDDRITTFLVTPLTPEAFKWIDGYLPKGAPAERTGFIIPPGFLAHKMLPAIRAAGLTAGGDVDEQGRITLRVQT